MSNEEREKGSYSSSNNAEPTWWLRNIDYVKRRVHERRVDKKKENASERSARVANSATVAVAILTGALVMVGVLQWCTLNAQQKVMRGQLDAMQVDQRPWVRAVVTIKPPIIFTNWRNTKFLNVNMSYELKNYGHLPARNIQISGHLLKSLGNGRHAMLDPLEDESCRVAREAAARDKIAGPTIFPGDTKTIEKGIGSSIDYKSGEAVMFSILGCVDYTYGSASHGIAAIRLMLGKQGKIFWEGLPFIEGGIIDNADPQFPAIRANSVDFDFEDDPNGGNYVE